MLILLSISWKKPVTCQKAQAYFLHMLTCVRSTIVSSRTPPPPPHQRILFWTSCRCQNLWSLSLIHRNGFVSAGNLHVPSWTPSHHLLACTTNTSEVQLAFTLYPVSFALFLVAHCSALGSLWPTVSRTCRSGVKCTCFHHLSYFFCSADPWVPPILTEKSLNLSLSPYSHHHSLSLDPHGLCHEFLSIAFWWFHLFA